MLQGLPQSFLVICDSQVTSGDFCADCHPLEKLCWELAMCWLVQLGLSARWAPNLQRAFLGSAAV